MVRWSQQARAYTMVVALGLVATLLLLRALERGTRSAWAVYGLSLAAVIVWHPVGRAPARRPAPRVGDTSAAGASCRMVYSASRSSSCSA